MRLSLHLTWHQRTLADAAVAAYSEWRGECAAVRASYRQWAGARREEERSAFIDYRSALDREEHAAERYARLMRRAGHLGKTGVLLQFARIQTAMASARHMASAALSAGEALKAPVPNRPMTAFVLSGGASLGGLQVGMVEALHEPGIAPDVLVATSVGALNAAFIASRVQTVATGRALSSARRDLQREDVFPVSLSALVGGVCGGRDHLVPDHGLRRLITRYLEFDDLADAPIPLHLVAFDLAEGRDVLVSRGPALESVIAAASIPGVFPPVRIGDLRLADGGVVNNSPISRAAELRAERVYVLSTGEPGRRRLECAPKTALDAAVHGVQLLVGSRLGADIARHAPAVELVVLPAPDPSGVQPTSFDHSGRLMQGTPVAARATVASQTVETPPRPVG